MLLLSTFKKLETLLNTPLKSIGLVVGISSGACCAFAQVAAVDSLATDTLTSTSRVDLKEAVVSSQYILGSKFRAANRTGSAYYVSPEEIQKFGYTDINRMLKAVPGVNMYEEDGFGLRPNISLRGTKAERSERISLMEDGILAAPAPYAAPAAYYFPNAARMHAVEVLKGSSQVQYGPFTTGGAINMVSTPVPNEFTARLSSSYGSNNTWKAHAMAGQSWRYVGYMVEYLRYQSDGFKHYADHKAEGFRRNDLLAKLLFKTDNADGANHRLELKFGFADEHSDETYLGLSATDFSRDPYLRYPAAEKDRMTTRHHQWAATYRFDGGYRWKFTAQAYYNHFYRNWYKLNDVRVGYTSAEKRSIDDVLADPETNHRYFDLVRGAADYVGEALIVRANQRSYRSRGVQGKLEFKHRWDATSLDAEWGIRFHKDEEDRFQWDDSYAISGGRMSLFLAGIPGTQSNRITSADAFATYLLGRLRHGAWTLTAGVRHENVDLLKKDYTKADLQRTGHVRQETPNHAAVWIPSVGVNCRINSYWSAFAGVHKGFAPPSAELYQKPESSWNTEAGLRFFNGDCRGEVIGFYNQYRHMLGSDLAAAGGQGTLEQFNVGRARVRGLEALLAWQPLPKHWAVRLPLQCSYTLTDTHLSNAFESSSWGIVLPGDEIPYIYKHAFNLQVGIGMGRWEANLGVNRKSDMRTAPGQGVMAEREKVPAHLILDASLKWVVNPRLEFTLNAVNLTNKVYLTSRHPSGLRAGHPFGIYGGFRLRW